MAARVNVNPNAKSECQVELDKVEYCWQKVGESIYEKTKHNRRMSIDHIAGVMEKEVTWLIDFSRSGENQDPVQEDIIDYLKYLKGVHELELFRGDARVLREWSAAKEGRRSRATKNPESIRSRVVNDLKQRVYELPGCLEDTFMFERSGRQGEEGDRNHKSKVKALVDLSAEIPEMRDDELAMIGWKKWDNMRREVQTSEEEFRQKYDLNHRLGMVDVYQPGRQVAIFVSGVAEQFIYVRTGDLIKRISRSSRRSIARTPLSEK